MGVLTILTILFGLTSSYKILVYNPQIGHSHVNYIGQIADTLAEAGHDVLVYLPEFSKTVTNKGVTSARILHRKANLTEMFDPDVFQADIWMGKQDSLPEARKILGYFESVQVNLCKNQLNDARIIEALINEKFDFAIAEVFDKCAYILFELLDIPVYISALSVNLFGKISHYFGTFGPSSYVPAIFTKFSDELSIKERLMNFFYFLHDNFLTKHNQNFCNAFSEQCNIEEKIRKSAFLFVNSEYYMAFPQPISRRIVYIGGIAVKQRKSLEKEFQIALDEAENGAVYISFGSLAFSRKMPHLIKSALIQMFAAFPNITFLWKYEDSDHLTSAYSNVIRKEWFPQNDILGHSNIKAFVSHGGMNSVLEGMHAGVPMICIPVFFDQMQNSKIAEKRKIAFVVPKESLNGVELIRTLKKILTDKEITISSRRTAQMIKERSLLAKERVLRHVDFAVKYGPTDNFDKTTFKLTILQLFSIDILLFAICSTILSCYLLSF